MGSGALASWLDAERLFNCRARARAHALNPNEGQREHRYVRRATWRPDEPRQ